jgi:rfaE bifunctional protein nucleotidyltransferase chain/domain
MSGRKILPLGALAELFAREPGRRSGLVLANGVFELLHVGHVRYLEGARAAGRSLVVALNSDASARTIKGPGRPFVPLAERMEVVAALHCVDWVEGTTVEEPLRLLKPEAHAKGTDYTVETVPERPVAEALGIRTVIVGDPKRHASSDLIRRVRGEGDR